MRETPFEAGYHDGYCGLEPRAPEEKALAERYLAGYRKGDFEYHENNDVCLANQGAIAPLDFPILDQAPQTGGTELDGDDYDSSSWTATAFAALADGTLLPTSTTSSHDGRVDERLKTIS